MIHRNVCLICILLFVVSCSDSDNDPNPKTPGESQARVTSIFRNGLSDIKLSYDAQGRLYRMEYYSNGNLSTYNIYEYDEFGVKTATRFKANHQLDYRRDFILDKMGRIVKSENYSGPDFEKLNSTSTYTYNEAGQLVRDDFASAGSPVYSRKEYIYDKEGRLLKLQNYLNPTTPEKYLFYEFEYAPGNQPVPTAWEHCLSLLVVSGVDDKLRDMLHNGMEVRSWSADGELSGHSIYEMSEREFDQRGNLLRQIITIKYPLNPEAADVAREMTYEYLEIAE